VRGIAPAAGHERVDGVRGSLTRTGGPAGAQRRWL